MLRPSGSSVRVRSRMCASMRYFLHERVRLCILARAQVYVCAFLPERFDFMYAFVHATCMRACMVARARVHVCRSALTSCMHLCMQLACARACLRVRVCMYAGVF